MNPIISVIVPIYNVEKYLEECLLSIQNQTYKHLQVIMINDGSTDNSAQIAQHFVDTDSRFQLIQQNNAGQSAARNKGLEQATGDFISFIDADDYIAPNFYEMLLHEICNADILQIGYTRIGPQGENLGQYYPCFTYQYTTPWSRLFQADFLRKHRILFEEGYIYEDVLFSLDVWMQKPTLRTIKYAGYYYRTNPTSTTSKKHDTRPLFQLIAQRKQGATIWQRLIIFYTTLRLRMHFLLNR